MGTHPIFESDFDCLTECYRVSLGFAHFRPLFVGFAPASKANVPTIPTMRKSWLVPLSGGTETSSGLPTTSGEPMNDGKPNQTFQKLNPWRPLVATMRKKKTTSKLLKKTKKYLNKNS